MTDSKTKGYKIWPFEIKSHVSPIVPGRTSSSVAYTSEEILKVNKDKAAELSMVYNLGSAVSTAATVSRFMIILAYLTNAHMTCMIQFMQIVDFFSKMAFINLKTSPFAYRIMQIMFHHMDTKFIPTPFRNYNYEDIDDAWIWKHQLSENGLPPFLLQDAGNEVFLVVFVYLLNLIFWPKYFKRLHSSLVGMKLMLFLIYWTDFLELSFRTLGHFTAVRDRQLLSWDNWVSVG